MKSIMQSEKKCFLCRREDGLDVHHCIEGSYRDQSTEYGLTIWLCRKCHRRLHDNEGDMKEIRRLAQLKAMSYYKWTDEDFRNIFGRSFINEEKND